MKQFTVWLPPKVADWLLSLTEAESEALAIQQHLVAEYEEASTTQPDNQ